MHAVLTPSSRPTLVKDDEAVWVGLPDPQGPGERATARLSSAGGTLIVKLLDEGGTQLELAAMTRDCPIPQSLAAAAGESFGDDEDGFGGGLSDVGGVAEDCDY